MGRTHKHGHDEVVSGIGVGGGCGHSPVYQHHYYRPQPYYYGHYQAPKAPKKDIFKEIKDFIFKGKKGKGGYTYPHYPTYPPTHRPWTHPPTQRPWTHPPVTHRPYTPIYGPTPIPCLGGCVGPTPGPYPPPPAPIYGPPPP